MWMKSLLAGLNRFRRVSGMRRIIVSLLMMAGFTLTALAGFPKIYDAVGTPLYQASSGYEALIQMEPFTALHEALQAYTSEADRLLQRGLELDQASDREGRQAYIKALRALSQKQSALDRAISKAIETLKTQQDVTVLIELQHNPYDVIRKMAGLKKGSSHTEAIAGGDKHSKLLELKTRLQEARGTNKSGEVTCLNDMTAMVYWMVQSDERESTGQWCDAAHACGQVLNYHMSAKQHCAENGELEGWNETLLKYEREKRAYFSKMCDARGQ
jgi:uncharacterized membrane protein